jgi:hypothetical protein
MFFGPVMMLVFFFLCLAILGMRRSSRGGYAIEILRNAMHAARSTRWSSKSGAGS